MADSRELTFGMDFDLDETIQQLGDILGSLERIRDLSLIHISLRATS